MCDLHAGQSYHFASDYWWATIWRQVIVVHFWKNIKKGSMYQCHAQEWTSSQVYNMMQLQNHELVTLVNEFRSEHDIYIQLVTRCHRSKMAQISRILYLSDGLVYKMKDHWVACNPYLNAMITILLWSQVFVYENSHSAYSRDLMKRKKHNLSTAFLASFYQLEIPAMQKNV